ncbi:MAG: hypothetical protein WBA57_22610 [Elainellaceae cyanobacterium]
MVTRPRPLSQPQSRCLLQSLRRLNGIKHAGLIGSLGIIGSLGMAIAPSLLVRSPIPSAQAFGFAPVSIQLTVNRVWGNPTVDLPPQRQRPDLYAEIDILGQSLTTPTEATPRINEAVYPEWLMSAVSEITWLERGNYIPVSLRIYDEDEGVDDKVLFSTLDFDPFACEVNVGSQTIAGVWVNNRSTCVVSIPDLQSPTGSAALTLSAQWIGVSPGR